MRFSIPRFAEFVSGRRSISNTNAVSDRPELAAGSTDYIRFIVLGAGRTGSNMVVQALNSSPSIRCFGEIFNRQMDFVGFNVRGYDNFSGRDQALRENDCHRFLCERVYCPHPQKVKAVGFKLLYAHVWGFRGLLERLVEDTDIRVLHLKRRNLLRMLLSSRIARATGVWYEDRRLTPTNIQIALRHPLRAAARLQRPLRRPKASRVRMTLSKEECQRFFSRMQWNVAHFDNLFSEHPQFTVLYEDILDDRAEVFGQVQTSLGLDPRPLKVTTRRQNPEPLRELIENYDELHEAFKDTPNGAFFD